MAKFKKGIYGMTRMRTENVLGTVIIGSNRFNNMEGEIISKRDDYMKYLTIQVPSEYKNRVYIINLLYEQCIEIKWKD